MGICLDTDQKNGSQVANEWEGVRGGATPPDGRFPLANGTHVKFELPKVPVIFVLGGPGSGKVTHADNLMHEKRGITHINMTDLLQQYAIGNDMKDFGQLSSKTVTEVLMLEMKMAPAAKTYLISGYPRSMRDVVEYAEKIQIVNGVILVAWQQKVLERQIDYGAKLGHVVLSLAKMELANFYKNVMPVAEYFDQRGMLTTIDGERNPTDVYKDFRSAVLRILGTADQIRPINQKSSTNQLNGGRIIAGFLDKDDDFETETYKPPGKGYPPVIWIIGGPGSNKAALCQRAIRQAPGWVHFSIGRLLRAAAETPDRGNDTQMIRQAISSGEMVSQMYMLQLVESQMNTNMAAQGILMDGFPRDMTQVHEFESKFKQQPKAILLDCSKLQLGRGRLDDSVAAFRRRLELFRELTLPMLKTLDNENRLTIVDGDSDTSMVQSEFMRVVQEHVDQIKRTGGMIVPEPQQHPGNAQLHDLEDLDPTSLANGGIPNGVPAVRNGIVGGVRNIRNNDVTRPSRDTIRNMYADVETYPMERF